MIPKDSSVYHHSLRIVDVEKTNTCLICGDKGDLERLIYCVQCKACAEHSYCQGKFHGVDDGKVSWKCEDCAPNNPKCGSEQLRKSERITHATEAKYNRMKMQKESGAVRKQKSVRSHESESTECLRKIDIEKRRQVLKDENVLYEKPESLKNPSNISFDKQALECEKNVGSEAIMSQGLYYPEVEKYGAAKPLSDPVWMGQFRLNKSTHFGLVAYMSSKACSNVHSAATRFPILLDVEMLLRRVVWPQNFDVFPPNGNSIALYFFPQYERDEMEFDGVLNDVIEQDLALKSVINNMELLIFSSHLLPPDDRRICKKYYLWGVFKSKLKSENNQSN